MLNKMKDDKLSQVFGLPTQKTDIITKEGEVIPYENKEQPKPSTEDVDKDFEKVRKNLDELMQQGSNALYYALEIAKGSEHPRAFEVVGNIMKQLSDINLQLLDAHKKRKDLVEPKAEEKTAQNVTNNAIFVGSTNELSKMIEDMRKGK